MARKKNAQYFSRPRLWNTNERNKSDEENIEFCKIRIESVQPLHLEAFKNNI